MTQSSTHSVTAKKQERVGALSSDGSKEISGAAGVRSGAGSFLKLHHLLDNPGAHTKRRRVGRGIGSGRGKTSSRGGKGQTARTGVSINGFQGGQMPLTRRFPKRGFVNIHRPKFAIVNLKTIQEALEAGRLSQEGVLHAEDFKKAGFFKNAHHGVRVLGEGTLTHKIHLQVVGITASARKMVEALGGECTLVQPFSPRNLFKAVQDPVVGVSDTKTGQKRGKKSIKEGPRKEKKGGGLSSNQKTSSSDGGSKNKR